MATNVLDNTVEIEGTIQFSGDLTIDCTVNGEITSEKGNLTLNPNSRVKGDIKANQLIVQGKVEGSIQATDCHLQKSADVKGDVAYKTLGMESGAKMVGSTKIIN